MKTRILTAIVMLAIFVPILWFSEYIVYPIALAILAAVAVLELVKCLGLLSDLWISIPLPLLSAGITLGVRFTDGLSRPLGTITVAFFLLALYLLALTVFRAGRTTYAAVAGLLCGCFYITVAFASLVLLRYRPNGAFLFLLPFIGSWVTDTFAYFTGRVCGRHKLAPAVSPKKTVEGSIGGIVFAVGAFLLYGLILTAFDLTPNYLALTLLGLAVSVVSQIGDLALSVIKRERGIKDYGRLFPGHGGVLDRFDSVIATAPLTLFFTLLGEHFVLFV